METLIILLSGGWGDNIITNLAHAGRKMIVQIMVESWWNFQSFRCQNSQNWTFQQLSLCQMRVIWGHLPTFTTDIQWGPLEILHVFSMALV